MRASSSQDHRNALLFLIALAALGWALILWSVANMSSPLVGLMMPMDAAWALREVIAVWIMWAVMMGAMMLPSAIPMLLVHRRFAAKRDPAVRHADRWFLAGYLLSWTVFSAAAAAAQWMSQQAGILTHMLVLRDTTVAGVILIAAGLFQFTALKAACLNKCRTPIGFILTEWREGREGAFRMGLSHGKYCIGCCWALMAVLFVGGVMNLATIALLSSIVLAEKLLPRGDVIARIGGCALVLWGLVLVF